MKKTIETLSLIALVLMGIALTGCQKIDNGTPAIDESAAAGGKGVTYTTTVSLPATKALAEDGTKTFAVGDRIAVKYSAKGGGLVTAKSAELTEADINGNSATFTITFDQEIDKSQGFRFSYPADFEEVLDENGLVDTFSQPQEGTLDWIARNMDWCYAEGAWTEDGKLPANIPLVNQIAIGKFTVFEPDGHEPKDVTGSVTQLIIKSTFFSFTVNPTSSQSTIYVAMLPENSTDYEITVCRQGFYSYTKTVEDKTFIKNTIHPIKLTLPEKHTVDLSKAYGEEIRIGNGATLTGALHTSTKITVPGGTVTLKDVDITSLLTSSPFAGITCTGNTTLVLEGDNKVNGGFGNMIDYPGIHIAPGYTLTIRGEGSLLAKGVSGAYDPKAGSAGIGGGVNISCGNIRIEGGTITAEGGWGSSGIGAGCAYDNDVSCGTIEITGGKVTATGKKFAAGIGSGSALGYTSVCGNISIIESDVTAVGGEWGAGIGTGSWDDDLYPAQSRCGSITITGGKVIARNGTFDPASTNYDVGVGSPVGTSVGTIQVTGVTVFRVDDGTATPANVQQNP